MHASESLDGPNAHPLKHEANNLSCCVEMGVVRPDLRLKSGECALAILTTPSLDFATPVCSKLLTRFVMTSNARHFGLDFFGPTEPK
jgi:hypothetical protein